MSIRNKSSIIFKSPFTSTRVRSNVVLLSAVPTVAVAFICIVKMMREDRLFYKFIFDSDPSLPCTYVNTREQPGPLSTKKYSECHRTTATNTS